jgi:hypothetical protein
MGREVTKDECLRVASNPNEFLRMIGEPVDEKEPGGGAAMTPPGAAQKAAVRR